MTLPKSGTKAYAISNLAYGRVESPLFAVTPGDSYRISAYVRGKLDSHDTYDLGANWSVKVRFFSDASNNLGSQVAIWDVRRCGGSVDITLTTTWQQVCKDGVVPAQALYMRVDFVGYYLSGWVAFDDVSIYNLTTNTERITSANNRGFENSTYWVEWVSSSFPGTSVRRAGDQASLPRTGSYAYSISNQAYGWIESPLVAVTPSEQYKISTYLRGEVDGVDSYPMSTNWKVRVRFFRDSSNNINLPSSYIGYVDVGNQCGTSTPLALSTNWQQVCADIVIPSEAYYMRVDFAVFSLSGWVAFDTPRFEKWVNGQLQEQLPGAYQGFDSIDWVTWNSISYPNTSIWHGGMGTTTPQAGSKAYVISNLAHGSIQSTPVMVEAGKTYEIKAYVRGELDPDGSDTVGWKIRTRFLSSTGYLLDGGVVDVVAGTPGGSNFSSSWAAVPIQGSVIVPANAVRMQVELISISNTGWVAFDDIQVTRSDGSTTNTIQRKYYFAGSQRIAVRTGNGTGRTNLSFLLMDHLGSTRAEVSWNGSNYQVSGTVRYKPWGESQNTSGLLNTDRKYTGQIEESALGGIYFYNARWYDPYITQFAQPDSIIPDPYNPLDWNRYSYVRYNPINNTDPTGHITQKHLFYDADVGEGALSPYPVTSDSLKTVIKERFGIEMVDGDNVGWSFKNLLTAYSGLRSIDSALHGNLKTTASGAKYEITDGGNQYYGWTRSDAVVEYHVANGNTKIPLINFLHETGHLLDVKLSNAFSGQIVGTPDWVDEEGYVDLDLLGSMFTQPVQARPLGESWDVDEYWADSFANYVAGNIKMGPLDPTGSGQLMYNFVYRALYPYANP